MENVWFRFFLQNNSERKAASEEAAADIAPEEKVLLLLAEIAAKANEDSSTGISIAEKDIDESPDSSNKADVSVSGNASEATSIAVEAFKTSDEIKCEECDSKFENWNALRNHKIRNHEVTNSPIPQIDGAIIEPKSFVKANQAQSVLKNQYPRICQHCNEFLRNNSDFRKHVVGCAMARKHWINFPLLSYLKWFYTLHSYCNSTL